MSVVNVINWDRLASILNIEGSGDLHNFDTFIAAHTEIQIALDLLLRVIRTETRLSMRQYETPADELPVKRT